MNRYFPNTQELFPASTQERNEQPFFNRSFVRPFRQEEDVLMRWLPYVQTTEARPAILLFVQGISVEIVRDFAVFLRSKYPVKVEAQAAPALENLLAGFRQILEPPAASPQLPFAPEKAAVLPSEHARIEAAAIPAKTPISADSQKDLLRIQKIIHDNLDNEQFKVGDLARSMNCCEMQLSRKLRQFTPLSPANYIRAYRLEEGKRLLQKPELNISEVAFRTGFRSPEYFTRCFKEAFGICPTNYKRNLFNK